MIRRLGIFFVTLLLALVVLFISAFNSATPKFEFKRIESLGTKTAENKSFEIDYSLPNTGKILPHHFLWPAKVVRDQLWLLVTTNSLKKSELLLHLADKRLATSLKLLEKGEIELAVSTLTKSEKYLERAVFQEEEARKKGFDTSVLLERLYYSTLKHWGEIEKLAVIVPEDARQIVIETLKYPQSLYEKTKVAIRETGKEPPECPFNR